MIEVNCSQEVTPLHSFHFLQSVNLNTSSHLILLILFFHVEKRKKWLAEAENDEKWKIIYHLENNEIKRIPRRVHDSKTVR